MLILWRICRRKYGTTAFSGEGAKLAGGRWNRKGTRISYCGGSLALAALEMLVHVDVNELPGDLVCLRAAVPDEVSFEQIDVTKLPRNWRATPAPDALKDIGTDWVVRGSSAVLAVPSAIIPSEMNYLVNPAHADFERVAVGLPEPFGFDPRLRRPTAPPPTPPKVIKLPKGTRTRASSKKR
ncbi:RES family NAD+ phosphorylase [Pendulispora albinea]|uniref:RES family NAD+ phosphorylase n=1 Tax=Pendulispora albinea TaxID=2741071 RepID=A0ABZ2LTG1_9BACT